MKILDICAQYITLSNRFVLNKNDIASRIKQYVDENYAQNITIEKICLTFFCSRTTATRMFREKYCLSIVQYLTMVRIQTAKRLLRGTSKTIGAIAEQCGYPDQNYFCKVFSKYCGTTPTAYRESVTS